VAAHLVAVVADNLKRVEHQVVAVHQAAALLAVAHQVAVQVVVALLKQAVLQPEAHQQVVHLLVVAHPVAQVEPAAVALPKLAALQNNPHQAKNWHNLVLHLAQLCLC
jgi:ABC-type transport system involved in cytochrome c biogenesis permease component